MDRVGADGRFSVLVIFWSIDSVSVDVSFSVCSMDRIRSDVLFVVFSMDRVRADVRFCHLING